VSRHSATSATDSPKIGLHSRVVEVCCPIEDRMRMTPIRVEDWKDLVERDLVALTRAAAERVVGGIRRDSVDAPPASKITTTCPCDGSRCFPTTETIDAAQEICNHRAQRSELKRRIAELRVSTVSPGVGKRGAGLRLNC
jgi:hypothetical protein